MEDITGEALGQSGYVLSRPATFMTLNEMSNNIVLPERKRFSGKVYKYNRKKNRARKVSLSRRAVFEAEYIFIVEPLRRDQIRGALTRAFENTTRILVSKKNDLIGKSLGKNLMVDENEGKETEEDAENETEIAEEPDQNDEQKTAEIPKQV